MDDDQRLRNLLVAFQGAERAILMTHDNPDPDSMASALALQTLLNEKLAVPSQIVYGGILGRAENRAMVSVLGIKVSPVEEIIHKPSDRIALLDTQPRTGNNSLREDLQPTAVFDHHPLRVETNIAPFHDVREGFGATATMLYRYLIAAKVRLSRTLATALYIAIKVETHDLSREVSSADHEAYSDLFPMVDHRAIAAIELAPLSREYYRTLGRSISRTRVYDTVAIADVGEVEFPDIVAEFADILIRLEGIRLVLAVGQYEGAAFLSLRTNVETANAGTIIRDLVHGWGKAGGHGSMAGGRIVLAKTYGTTLRELTARFLELMNVPMSSGSPL